MFLILRPQEQVEKFWIEGKEARERERLGVVDLPRIKLHRLPPITCELVLHEIQHVKVQHLFPNCFRRIDGASRFLRCEHRDTLLAGGSLVHHRHGLDHIYLRMQNSNIESIR